MARGTPDWGLYAAKDLITPTLDAGELAARLFSPVTHDRRGNVFWLDDFDGGIAKWLTESSGTGADFYPSDTRIDTGTLCAAIQGGSTLSRYAMLYRRFGLPTGSVIGVEASLYFDSNITKVYIKIMWNDVATRRTATLVIYPSPLSFYYVNSAGVETLLFSHATWSLYDGLFHHIKLVADMANGKYYRVVFDDLEYSLSVALQSTAGNNQLRMFEIDYRVDSDPATNALLYLDNVILTVNEI